VRRTTITTSAHEPHEVSLQHLPFGGRAPRNVSSKLGEWL
jgi:hypothetical protein